MGASDAAHGHDEVLRGGAPAIGVRTAGHAAGGTAHPHARLQTALVDVLGAPRANGA